MTPSQELLRFFHAEAREYLDAVEELATEQAPFEAGAFVAASRALRGSATMARVPRVAEIALAMERIANGVRDGEIPWSGDLRHDLLDAITDLRDFVERSGTWTADDDRHAMERLASLRRLIPATTPTTPSAPVSSTTPIFIALQAAAVSTDIETLLSERAGPEVLGDLVNRLRSLRGIAGVADHPPLGDIADQVERTLREVAPDAMLRTEDTELLAAASALFRRASSDLRVRGRFDSNAAEVERFARAAVAAGPAPLPPESPVVRIEELFFTDEGPHLVRRGAAPPRSAEARFRAEVIARAEHLRRLVAEARAATDAFTKERVSRDLKAHLGQMDEFARSFGAQQVATIAGEAAREPALTAPSLQAIDALADVLTTPGIGLDEMESRLAVSERQRWTPAQTPVSVVPAARQAPAPSAAGAPRSGAALHQLLHQSLSKLAALEDIPLAEPTQAPDDDAIVPVEALLYRGNAALERARELRDALRRSGSADPDALQELYDLLDLARTG